MPPQDHKTNDARPVTRAKNATTHPGRALSNGREPELIEKEKLERKAKKEAREHKKSEEMARKEAAQRHIEALRAQQTIDLEDEELEQPKGKKTNLQGASRAISESGMDKGLSSVTVEAANTAMSAGNRGQKRKSDMRQQDDTALLGNGHDMNLNPPAKKGKALPSVETRPRPRPRPVPRPLKKKGFEVAQGEEANQLEGMDPSNHHNTKKRPSEAVDMAYPENDPKTPVPSKKAKVGLNKKSKDTPIPIRRTETMIELVGSKVVTRRPTITTDASEEDADDEKAMPYPGRRGRPTDSEDVEPYQTPVALTPANWKKNKARALAEDTEVESSDTEVENLKKKGWALNSAADKLLSATRSAMQQEKFVREGSPSIPRSSNVAAPKSLGSRTTALNEVTATRSSDGPSPNFKSKPTKTSKKPNIVKDDESEIAPAIGDEDHTKEREALLSSPLNGKDSRKSTATQVKVKREEQEKEILSANEKKQVKEDVIPHFMQKYTSQIDCFAPLTVKDFKVLEDLCHRVMGRPLLYKLTKDSEVVKMVSAKLSDYRTQFRIQGDNNARFLSNIYFNGDTNAIKDRQKRVEFGLYYCMEDEYKFQFRGSERRMGEFKASGRFLSKIYLDTFSIHYRYTLPRNPLPNWDTPIPVGGLAMAAAAIDRALTLYRDDHYEYVDNTLSIKQPPASQSAREKAMRNKAARGVLEGENDKVPCTSKFHFSKGKYGDIVLAWHGVLIHKAMPNFQNICEQARRIFGVKDDVEVGNGVHPEVRTRVGLDSESESGEEDGLGNDGEDENRGNNLNSTGNHQDDEKGDDHGNDGNNDDHMNDKNDR